MKIAITGGAGFVGSQLARAYLDAGHDVLVIDSLVNGSRRALDPRARFYPIDIRDAKVQVILQQERPDILSHHVYQRDRHLTGEQPLTDADVHLRGLLNVLDGCVNASVNKVIFASGGNTLYSPAAFSPSSPDDFPVVKEDTMLNPQCSHDINMMTGEWYARYYTRQYGLRHTILRYADIYGETNVELAQHPLTHFICCLAENRRPTIRGSAKALRDHIFIDDVVKANLLALERGHNQTMHISSGKGYDLNQFFSAAAHLFRSEITPVYVSGSLSGPTAIALDNSLAQRLLGWRPEVTFTDGVRLAVERLCGNLVEAAPVKNHMEERAGALALV